MLRDTDVIIRYINGVEDVLGVEVDEAYYKALKTVQERPGAEKNVKVVYTPLHGTGNVPVRTMLSRLG